MESGPDGEYDRRGVLLDRSGPGTREGHHPFGRGAGRPAVADLGARRESSLAGDAQPRASAPACRKPVAVVVRELVNPGARERIELLADAQRGPHEETAVSRQAIGERGELAGGSHIG